MVTTQLAAQPTTPSDQLIEQLGRVCQSRGLPDLAGRLADFHQFVQSDLRELEAELATVDRGVRAVQRAAHHLLDLGGKHLRPICVMLAARTGAGFDENARQLALAVELVHTATLLHDDVVDLGDRRRGAEAARMIYGNAASVFAGDWLLVQALKRVRRAGLSGAVDRLLDIIDEMILAESLQLEQRGQIAADADTYFQVVEGKTAALFRWAMWAGGRAGKLSPAACAALEQYGRHLGVAFQVVDDCLDFASDSAATGKSLFTDLREGKMTYPMILAMQRDPGLAALLVDEVTGDAGSLSPALLDRIRSSLIATGALEDSRALAIDRVDRAIGELAALPGSRAVDALVTVAQATAHRER